MYHGLFIQPPTEGHLGHFQVWAIMCNIATCRFLCGYPINFLWVNTKECNCWFRCLRICLVFVRNYQTVFQSDCIILYSFQQCEGLPRWFSGKESACQCRRHRFDPWDQEDLLEGGMATHFSILAGIIPWTEEPSGL